MKPSDWMFVESRSAAVVPAGKGMDETTFGLRASLMSSTAADVPAHGPEGASVATTAVVPTTDTSP